MFTPQKSQLLICLKMDVLSICWWTIWNDVIADKKRKTGSHNVQPHSSQSRYKLKKCSKKECCKHSRYVKFKGNGAFAYRLLRVLAMFDVTRFSRTCRSIGRHFKRYVDIFILIWIDDISLKQECCKQCRYVTFKGTMAKLPVQKPTHITTQKHV